MDQDDVFVEKALEKLKQELLNAPEEAEIVAVDLVDNKNGILSDGKHYIKNDIGWITGGDYIRKCEVSWVPWAFVYRRKFLVDNHIRFVENVRFEDVDYIMDAFRKAKLVKYVPIPLVSHSIWDGQTSAVGNNFELIRDLFRISTRVANIANDEYHHDQKVSEAILGHHHYMHKIDIKRYIWRLSYSQQKEILLENKYIPGASISFSEKIICNPKMLLSVLFIMRPFLFIADKTLKFLRKIK